jgi:hypothetical protein
MGFYDDRRSHVGSTTFQQRIGLNRRRTLSGITPIRVLDEAGFLPRKLRGFGLVLFQVDDANKQDEKALLMCLRSPAQFGWLQVRPQSGQALGMVLLNESDEFFPHVATQIPRYG